MGDTQIIAGTGLGTCEAVASLASATLVFSLLAIFAGMVGRPERVADGTPYGYFVQIGLFDI